VYDTWGAAVVTPVPHRRNSEILPAHRPPHSNQVRRLPLPNVGQRVLDAIWQCRHVVPDLDLSRQLKYPVVA
jgi:hypothetical protein